MLLDENNMAGWLILVVMVIYLLIGFDFFLVKNYPMAVVFAAYALGNLGLYFVR